MAFEFGGDNIINVVTAETGIINYKFRDSYTITIYNAKPNGINGREFYAELSGVDTTLNDFLSEIFVSLKIEDGSLEKTIVNETLISLNFNDQEVEYYKQHNHSEVKLPNRHINLLGSHYHMLASCSKITVSINVESFKILSNKYLVMDFDLRKIVMHKSNNLIVPESGLMMPLHHSPLELTDFLECYEEVQELPDSELNKIYVGHTAVRLNLI